MKIVKTYKEKQIQIEYLINEKQTVFNAKIILQNISYNKSFTFYFNFNYLFVNIEKEDMKCYINDQRDYVAYYDKMGMKRHRYLFRDGRGSVIRGQERAGQNRII